MPSRQDLTGQTIRNVKVLKYVGVSRNHKSMFLCKCFCGKEFICIGANLKNGTTNSCGCYMRKISSENGKKNKIHGFSKHRLFNIHKGILERCYKEKNHDYKIYGARGIKVCDEWVKNKESFFNWAISNGYKDGLTIDRIDTNGNYEPANCRWVDYKIQARNRRNNHIVEYNDEKHCIADWADILNYDYIKLKDKLKTYSLKDIIEGTCKPKNVKFITYDNQTKSAKEWAEILNITHHCLITRLRRNWSLDRIFNNYNKEKLCLN